jgi:Rod binding domain-containing protein
MNTPPQSVSSGSSISPQKLGQLRQQAEDLEGVFINTLMKEMFSSLKTDQSAMGGGFAEETWRGMQAEQLSDSIARAGGVGIADTLMSSLLALQETSSSTPSAGALK